MFLGLYDTRSIPNDLSCRTTSRLCHKKKMSKKIVDKLDHVVGVGSKTDQCNKTRQYLVRARSTKTTLSGSANTRGWMFCGCESVQKLPKPTSRREARLTWPMVSRSPLISASGREEGKPLIVIIAAMACAAVRSL